MPLDWDDVVKRYDGGTSIPTVAGGKQLVITGVDDTGVHIRHSLWRDTLAREHLEKAAALIEADEMSRHAGLFVEEYRAVVADVRATSAAHVLKDLGFLE
ncbi:MAG TPA: hypothetical protein VM367_00850 [Pseudonocardia sp.]|nr:hypothetical protein [Pseudonocardia sp.]